MESHTIGFAIALILVVCHLMQKAHSYIINKVRNNIQHSHSGIVALPPSRVRKTLHKFYQSKACSFDCIKDGAWAYQRGCILTFRQVDHTVNWHLVPQVVSIVLLTESGKTKVDICYRVLPTVRITQKAANQFVACASSEGTKALEMLKELSCKNEAVMKSGRTSAASDAGRSEGFAEGLIEDSYERRGQPSEIPG
ncbi:MAG: hypothetical protein HS101_20040 [Planctomycetia bacterium]|nr:hypothetical protein [Planctomycetia bacterium]